MGLITKCFNSFLPSRCISNHPFISKSILLLQSCKMKTQIQQTCHFVLRQTPTSLQLTTFQFWRVNSSKETGFQMIESTVSCLRRKEESPLKCKLWKRPISTSQCLSLKQSQSLSACWLAVQKWQCRTSSTSGFINSTKKQNKQWPMKVGSMSARLWLTSIPRNKCYCSKGASTAESSSNNALMKV